MEQKSYRSVMLLITLLLLIPSCGKLIDWGERNFNQGNDLCIDYSLVRSYLRSTSAYDQLSLIAQFDALWLNQEVRDLYVDAYVEMAGKTEEQRNSLLKRQIDENKHFIMFFILVPYDIPLGQPNSIWSILLKIDNSFFDPIEVKEVELFPIYRAFFGKKYTRFKMVYQVKFDAKTVQDTSLINANTEKIELYFRSVEKELSLNWHLKQPIPADAILLTAEKAPVLPTDSTPTSSGLKSNGEAIK